MKILGRVAACVTTLNELQSIGKLVQALRGLGVRHVIVADAASTDGTPVMAHHAGARVLNVGRVPIGSALVAAWSEALVTEPEVILQLDAGNSHDPRQATRLIDRLVNDGNDLVVGSRFAAGSLYLDGRTTRRWSSYAAAVACNVATGRWITSDWTSGYRAFKAETLLRLVQRPYHAGMHGWQIEVLARALRLGLKIGEAPITYRAGRSSLGPDVALEALSAWTRLALRRT